MKRSSIRFAALTGAASLALAATLAAAQPAPPGDVLAAGLSNPRGLTADGDAILVAEVGGGQITRIEADGSTSNVVTGLPATVFFSAETGTDEVAGPSSVIPVDGGYVFTVSEAPGSEFQSVYFAAEDASGGTLMVDLGAHEVANNTDGDVNLAGDPDLLSNPYDVVEYDDGFLVSDSGANAILKISGDGTVTPFAIFENKENPLFPDLGGPTMDQVPTGLAVGPDGAIYVGTLTGFPFPTGGAVVYRMEDGNGDGDALDAGETTVYAEGLTTVTDVDFDANGDLVASEFSTNMLAEAPGQVVRFSGGALEVVANGLITPTALLVSDGRILVSQEFTGLVTDVTDAGVTTGGPVPTPAETGAGAPLTEGSPLAVVALLAGAAALLGGARRVTAR